MNVLALILAFMVILFVDLADEQFQNLCWLGLFRAAVYLALALLFTFLYWLAMSGYWPNIKEW